MRGSPERESRRFAAMLSAVLLSAALLGAVEARAQGIRATVNRAEVTVQDQIVLSIIVDGSRSAQPALPELPDFDVFPRGHSSQINIVGGRATTSITHTYLLVPRRAGTFTIPPATVEIDGRTLASQPFVVTVLEAEAQPQEARDVFVTAKVSTKSPYVGQQVVYTWQLYRRVRLGDPRLDEGEFDGFVVEVLGELREYSTTLNGQEYVVSEIRKALFPQEVGPATVPASRLSCRVEVRDPRRRNLFDDIFGRAMSETKVLRTPAIELDVRPLPPPPPGFAGLVGDFEVVAGVSKRQLKVGESTTLRVTVSGTGNVQMIGEPRLPELPYLKVYDDKPGSSIDRSGAALTGSKSYRKALVPLETGKLSVPSLSLTYFDPEAGSYRTARAPEIVLEVTPADGEEELRLTESVAPSTGKVAVRILADDILPPYKGLDAVDRSWSESGPAALAGGLLLPPFAFLGVLLAYRRRRRFELDAGLRRRRGALGRARRELRRIAARRTEGDGLAMARDASRCLREYIGDKLGREGCALTPMESASCLRERGVPEELVERTHGILRRLEAAQYGAGEVSVADLSRDLEPLLASLERRLG